jgi:hypothetical protein
MCTTLKVLSLDLHGALSRVLFGFSLAFLRPLYDVLSQLCFLKPMLKFSVQTFYQPLFSTFPLVTLFPSKSFPHKKAQSKALKAKSRKQMPFFLL